MNALRVLQKHLDERQNIVEIVSDDRAAVRGYVFIIEHRGNVYALVHPSDLNLAVAEEIMVTGKTADKFIGNTPITEDWHRAIEVSQGVFLCASSLTSDTRNRV